MEEDQISVKKTKKSSTDLKKEIWLGIHAILDKKPKGTKIEPIIARFALSSGFSKQTIQDIVTLMVEAQEIEIENGTAKKL